ncbi:MAG TPA: TetR/AcrR family transcriptional regulator [Caulobacter sp.]|nr:TetR/AcrR family transcriptional regulator [Caulobacter sp.]
MASTLGGTRSERKRGHILDAARDVFAREGFSQAGMEQVARLAGVSTATLYAHFPSKAELFRVVVEDTINGLAGDIAASSTVTGDARTRLTAFATAYAVFYSDPTSRALFRMVVSERRRFPALAEHYRMRGRNEFGGAAITLVRDLVSDGALAAEKPARAAGQLQGMIEHATLLFGLVEGDEARASREPQEIAADAVETFLARYAVREKA